MDGLRTRLAQAAGRIGAIEKKERNTQQGFQFRSIEAITAAVRPVFADLGISIAPQVRTVDYEQVESSRGSTGYRCIAIVDFTVGCDGPQGVEELVLTMAGEAVDFGDKATSKAVQMAYKYALTELLIIGSADADHDGVTVDELAPRRTRKPNPVTALKKSLVEQHGKDIAAQAWATLFETDPEPEPEDMTEPYAEGIRKAIQAIVDDLMYPFENPDPIRPSDVEKE